MEDTRPGAWRRALALLVMVGAALAAGRAGAAEPSLEPMLRIEPGMHTRSIWQIGSDAQGRWAFTAGEDKAARIWELSTGRLLQTLRPPAGTRQEGDLFAGAMSPDGEFVAVGGSTAWDWAGHNEVYLFDRASGHMKKRLIELPASVMRLAFSPDGAFLAVGLAGTSGLRVWNLREGGVAVDEARFGDRVSGLSWSRDGRLALTTRDGKLRLYRVGRAGAKVALDLLVDAAAPGGGRVAAAAFHPDGERLAIAYEETPRIDVLNARSLALLYSADVTGIAADSGALSAVAWSADGQSLAAGGSWSVDGRHSVRIWSNAGRGAARDVAVAANTISSLWPAVQGGWLVAGSDPLWGWLSAQGQWQEVGRSPSADLRSRRSYDKLVLAAGGSRVQFSFGNRQPHAFDLATRRLSVGAMTGGDEPDVQSLDIRDWFASAKPTLGTRPLQLSSGGTLRSTSLAIAPDLNTFAMGSQLGVHLFRKDGTQEWLGPVPGPAWSVNITRSGPQAGKLLVAAYNDGTIRWHRLSDGAELLALFLHSDRKRWVLWTPSGYYDASPGGEDLIGWQVNRLTLRGMRVREILDGKPAALAGLRVGDVITHIDDTELTRVDQAPALVSAVPRGGSLRVTFQRAGQTQTVRVTPVVDANQPEPRIGITFNSHVAEMFAADFFPASRFRNRFFRPDVIDRVLETLDEAKALRLADQASNRRQDDVQRLAQQLPPVVELVGNSQVETQQAGISIRVKARTVDGAPVTGWRVRVNGELVPDARTLEVVDAGATEERRDLYVPLPQRDSEVLVFAENRHGVSTPALVRVAWRGSPAELRRPRLYVLAIGVGQYQSKQVNTLGELPGKDARDFVAAIRRQGGRLYERVEVRLLTDGDATRDNIVDALEWLQRQPQQFDVSMLFVSGHGFMDPAMGYLFLPVNANPDAMKRTTVNWSDFKSTISAMAGKRVVFMDTCHAGNALGVQYRAPYNDITGVVADLVAAENGVVVFASSTGRQLSVQDPSWGNGAFTKAVVEGLSGQAPTNTRGEVTHKRLSLYVSDRVKALTDGRQTPVNPDPVGVPDFPIALK